MIRPPRTRPARLSLAAWAATCVLAPGPSAQANPLDLFGFGPRSSALAGACTAACTDAAANFHNPGALAAVRQVELAVGYTLAAFDLKLNGEEQPVDDSRGVLASVVMPAEIGGMPVAFGTGIFLPDQRLTRVRALPSTQPRWVLFDNKPQRLSVTANLSVEPLPGLQVGGGITYMAATRGTVRLKGELVVPDPEGERTSLLSSVDVDLEAIRYPSAGARWAPNDRWAFAVAWRSEFSLDLDLTTVIEGDLIQTSEFVEDTTLSEGARFQLRSTNRVLFSPHQVVAGVAATPVPSARISADLAWSRWSTFPTPAATVAPELSLPGLLDDATSLFPTTPATPPPDFHDTLSPRVGAELDFITTPAHTVTARVGYAFEPTPAPVPTGPMNLVDTDRHVFGLGLAWQIGADGGGDPIGPVPGPITLEAHASHMHMAQQEVLKADPADRVGDYTALGGMWTTGAWVRARF